MGFLQDLGSGNIGKALGTDLTGGNSLVGQAGKGIANLSKDPLVDALAGAALMYFDPMGAVSGLGSLTNLGTAGAAGLITGGITGLASGNLGQGLKAGLAAYGGAGAENYLSNMGTTATAASSSLEDPNSLQSLTQQYPSAFRGDVGDYSPTVLPSGAGTSIPAAATNTGNITTAIQPTSSSIFSQVGPDGKPLSFMGSLGQSFSQAQPLTQAAVVAGGIGALKALATPQKLNAPAAKVGNIRQYSYNPYTGQMTPGPVTPANQFTGPVTAANYGATGGLVALARGGSVHHYDDGGSVSPFAATVLAADNANNIPVSSAVQNEAATGSPYTTYTPTQMAQYIQQQGINTSDPAALAAAEQATNADPAAVQAFLASGADPYSAQSLANPAQSNVSSFDAQLGTKGATTDINNAVYAAQSAASVPGGTANSTVANTQIAHEMDTWGVDPTAMGAAVGMSAAQIQALYNQVNPNGRYSTVQQNNGGGGGGGGGGGYGSYTNVSTPTSINTAPATSLMPGVGGNTGPTVMGGGTTINPNGTITTSPVIPGISPGGFTGAQSMRNAWINGGGSLGYTNPAPTSMDQFNQEFNTLTGGSQAAYDFLMGKTTQPKGPTKGPIGVPYFQAVGMAPKNLGFKLPNGMIAMPQSDGSYLASDGNKYNADGSAFTPTKSAGGGLMGIHMAMGGMTPNVGHLGGYSDGGRLLRGPGDGVSDSIPATIGSSDPEPARLADGEFVVPARIVSELGNGSTEAGARQLYKMMDRIQTARRKTTGKDAVATNTNTHQYLPA